MPRVPEYNHKPIKSIYNPTNAGKEASYKQRNLILVLCERRKIKPPDLTKLTMGEAAQLISNMLNDKYYL